MGDPQSPESLAAIDREVARLGITGDYARNVTYVRPAFSDHFAGPFDARDYALVDYELPGARVPDRTGVEVWINYGTGERSIVPKTVLRSVDQMIARAGYDLTQRYRTVDGTPSDLYVSYWMRHDPKTVVLDGTLMMKLDKKSGKPKGGILH